MKFYCKNDVPKNQSSADTAIRLPNTSILNSSVVDKTAYTVTPKIESTLNSKFTIGSPAKSYTSSVKIYPKISAPKIAASTSNTLGRSVSAETVRRVLRKAGYNGRVARKSP
ncbi:hypothetical protein TNCV_1533441 [Trichonephila clavipes]|nr:hypothetical protein TNCV_1533441 [Trichonephila clavipes]